MDTFNLINWGTSSTVHALYGFIHHSNYGEHNCPTNSIIEPGQAQAGPGVYNLGMGSPVT